MDEQVPVDSSARADDTGTVYVPPERREGTD